MSVRLNSKMQQLLATSLVVAALGLGGCATTITHGGYAYRPHASWYDYDYYPTADVYVDIVSGDYWHRADDRWHRTRRPPGYLRLDAPDRVRLRVDSVRPYEHHAEHRARYRGSAAAARRLAPHGPANAPPQRTAAHPDRPRHARHRDQGAREQHERRSVPSNGQVGQAGSGAQDHIHAGRTQTRAAHRVERDLARRQPVRGGLVTRPARTTQPPAREHQAAQGRAGRKASARAEQDVPERRRSAAARAGDTAARPARRAGGADARRAAAARDEDAPRTAADRQRDERVPR